MPWGSLPREWAESLILRSHTTSNVLLPRLAKLEWKAVTQQCLVAGLSHFITPHITSLSIAVGAEDAISGLPAVVDLLQSKLPPLGQLGLTFGRSFTVQHWGPLSPETICNVALILRTCCNITNLQVDTRLLDWALTYTTPPLLFPDLKRLSLHRDVWWKTEVGVNPMQGQPAVAPGACFPVLEHISTESVNWHRRVPSVVRKRVTSLEMLYMQPWSSCIFQGLLMKGLEAAGETCTNLKSFQLRATPRDGPVHVSRFLQPLQQCVSIEELDLRMPPEYIATIRDDEVIEMARSWPKLHRFSMQSIALSIYPVSNSLSFNSLLTLLRHCPDLRSVDLSMDIGEEIFPDNSYNHEVGYRMDHIGFGHSTVSRPGNLAVWLRDVCRATAIQWAPGLDEPRTRMFKDMQLMVAQLQLIGRQRERQLRTKVQEMEAVIRKLNDEMEEMRREITSIQR
jgi:uncharacterized coiled-coil protein SlyX